jgi:hypothetical protein
MKSVSPFSMLLLADDERLILMDDAWWSIGILRSSLSNEVPSHTPRMDASLQSQVEVLLDNGCFGCPSPVGLHRE